MENQYHDATKLERGFYMQIIIDLDGTICTEEKTYSRSMAKPIMGAVKAVNDLFDSGNTIIIYSSRSWQEYEMTQHWLKQYNVRYTQLILGKPIGEVWIDDRAIKFSNWQKIIRDLNHLHNKKK